MPPDVPTLRYLSYDRLLARGQSAIVVLRLMMAAHDLGYVNQRLGDHKSAQVAGSAPPGSHGRYLVRVQIAHLAEALPIIGSIRDDPGLLALVRRCDPQTQTSFDSLLELLKGGARYPDFQRLILRVRHNLGFHYGGDESGNRLISAALRSLASEHRISALERGRTPRDWRFQPADDVIDRAVVRELWRVDSNLPEPIAADGDAMKMHEMFVDFVDFAGEFLWRYWGS